VKVAVPLTVTVVVGWLPQMRTAKPAWSAEPLARLTLPSLQSIESEPVQTLHAACAGAPERTRPAVRTRVTRTQLGLLGELDPVLNGSA